MIELLFLMLLPLGLFASLLLDIGGHHDGDNGDAADEHIVGTGGDDLLSGGAGNDDIFAGAGADVVQGLGGDDTIWAGEGDDGATRDVEDMTDAEISDLIFGGDTAALQGFVADNTSFGGDGGAGNDYVNGGPGNDVLTSGAGNDVVRGSSGDDLVIDLQGANTLNGGFGDDDLWGFDRDGTNTADLLQGLAGNDRLLGDDGDTMEGGDGVDAFYTVWQSGDAPVTITDFDPATEHLSINTSELPDSPVLQLVDLVDGTGTTVMLNGETMAVLQGVTAAQVKTDGFPVENIRLIDRVEHAAYTPELVGTGLDETF